MPIDLHIHTTCSDGTFTPEEIVSLALGAGLSAIAITDHDAVDGVQRARDASRGAIEVVPGVELEINSSMLVTNLLQSGTSPSKPRLDSTSPK